MIKNVRKSSWKKFPLFAYVYVFVCQRSKKWITCNPRTDWAIKIKYGVLKKLLLLFCRTMNLISIDAVFNNIFFLFFNANRRKHESLYKF